MNKEMSVFSHNRGERGENKRTSGMRGVNKRDSATD